MAHTHFHITAISKFLLIENNSRHYAVSQLKAIKKKIALCPKDNLSELSNSWATALKERDAGQRVEEILTPGKNWREAGTGRLMLGAALRVLHSGEQALLIGA